MSGLAVDEANGKLYWNESRFSGGYAGTLWQSNLDGSGVTTIYDGAAYPFRLTLPRSKAGEIFSDSFEDVL